MMKTGRSLCLLLLALPLACSSKSGMKVSADAGKDASAITPEDAKTTIPDVSDVPDLAMAPDAVVSRPDIPDLAMAPDAVADRPDTGNNDIARPVMDVAPDVSQNDDLGTTFSADGQVSPDALPDAAMPDTPRDLGPQGEAGVMVSGVEVIPYQDYGTADTKCVEGTASWFDSLTLYLAEDRRCFADSDCQYVSFSNSCGQVCPVPMNTQRIGEFAQHAIGDQDPKCSTCPELTSTPICPAPPGDGSVLCSQNVCVWK